MLSETSDSFAECLGNPERCTGVVTWASEETSEPALSGRAGGVWGMVGNGGTGGGGVLLCGLAG